MTTTLRKRMQKVMGMPLCAHQLSVMATDIFIQIMLFASVIWYIPHIIKNSPIGKFERVLNFDKMYWAVRQANDPLKM